MDENNSVITIGVKDGEFFLREGNDKAELFPADRVKDFILAIRSKNTTRLIELSSIDKFYKENGWKEDLTPTELLDKTMKEIAEEKHGSGDESINKLLGY